LPLKANTSTSWTGTTIKLCLSVCPWATYRKTKGAIKLHFGLDGDGYLPTFMDMTDRKTHDLTWARPLDIPQAITIEPF
jgi:hypothetical protein